MPTKLPLKPKKSKSVDLTISIVSYNTREYLQRCLNSIYKFTRSISFEVIVIDNTSKDGSAKMVETEFPQVKLIKNKTNKFYAKANNQALKLARGKYFLILNTDIFLKSNAFKVLVNYLDNNPNVASVEPRQEDETGRIEPTGVTHTRPLADIIELTMFHRLFSQTSFARGIKQSSRNRRQTWETDVICDAVMMTRTKLFRQIGGYEEKLKLYFTENDLCFRLQRAGGKNMHLGSVAVGHTISASTDKEGWKRVGQWYAEDAYVYYQKHYHPLVGWLVKNILLMNISLIELKKDYLRWLTFLAIILTAAFLRFYRLAELMPFIGDYGRDFLAARDFILTKKIPLLGIPSSVPRFRQGPVYVWLTALALGIGNFDPLAAGFLAATLGLVAVGATYLLAEKYLSRHAAFVAGLILATSPLAVTQSRAAFHTNAIPLTSAVYLATLISFYHKRISIFWTALAFALLFQFELVVAPLALLIPLTFYLSKTKPQKIHLTQGLLGLGIGLLPQIIFDLTHKFQQLGQFIIWIGYRITSCLGIFPEHATSSQKLVKVLQIIFAYAQRFFSWGITWPTVIALLLIALSLISLKRSQQPTLTLSAAWTGILIISFLILGNASEAYFPAFFVPISLMFGWSISRIKPLPPKISLTIAVAGLALFNSLYIINHQFLIRINPPSPLNPFSTSGPPLKEQISVAKTIIRSTTGPLNLQAIGPGSEFSSFLDNYRYLIWWLDRRDFSPTGTPVWIQQQQPPSIIMDTRTFYFDNVAISLPLTSPQLLP